MLRYATPLTFAAIGGMFSERSGVVNIALEGMMLSGAFFGILAAQKSDSWAFGLLAAMAAGATLALIHAFFSIQLRADQIVSGTAINFLALGVTGYFFVDVYGEEGTPEGIPRDPGRQPAARQDPGGLGEFLDDVLGSLNLMIWLSFLLLIVSYIVMFKMPIGLRIRSVGEHPRAADTVGISVYGIRYLAVIVSGILAALGGAYLSIGFLGSFNENMTAGRGLHRPRRADLRCVEPFGAFAAALLFGFSSALAQRLPEYSGSGRDLVPGAAVRLDADRRRRRDRPFDPARRHWSPLRQAVTDARGATLARRSPSCSGFSRWRRCRRRSSSRASPTS